MNGASTIASRVATALVASALAALLFGCGDSAQSEADPATTPTPAKGPTRSDRPAEKDGASGHDIARAATPVKKKASSGSAGADTVPKPGENQHAGRSEPAPKPRGNCPASLNRRQCVEAGEAYEQSKQAGGSHTVGASECPPAMSKSACEQAGKAHEEAAKGQVVQPNECPPAMTEAQCVEAGKIYEEASR
ncbi:MAG TPA: hypothetical protein VFR04_08125 [Solirubrobacterales bacterium]|nr:hypothetical protein [Solirubrobacterales bacterium]